MDHFILKRNGIGEYTAEPLNNAEIPVLSWTEVVSLADVRRELMSLAGGAYLTGPGNARLRHILRNM